MPTTSRTIRIGTRGSKLARWQAEWVAGELAARDVPVELVPITTQGDVTSGPLGQIGGIGLFTKEIQLALLDDRIDVAVHSLKDLPTIDIPELALAAVPKREECGDALVSHVAGSLAELPEGAKVGTGSMRRKAQLLHFRGDLNVLDIRGNIDTRLKKLDDGEFDAIILAEAGLRRMGWQARIACSWFGDPRRRSPNPRCGFGVERHRVAGRGDRRAFHVAAPRSRMPRAGRRLGPHGRRRPVATRRGGFQYRRYSEIVRDGRRLTGRCHRSWS